MSCSLSDHRCAANSLDTARIQDTCGRKSKHKGWLSLQVRVRDRTVRDGEGRATRVPGDPKHDTAAGLGDLELIAALDGMAAASDVPSPAQSHHSAIKH